MIINQVTVPCIDYEKSVAFYKTLGLLQIVDAPPRYARFEEPNGKGATFSIHTVEETVQSDFTVYFDYPSAKALDRHVDELETVGLEFNLKPKDQSWGWREARLLDPSENQICLMFAGSARRFPPWRLNSGGKWFQRITGSSLIGRWPSGGAVNLK